jgi:hypothetical protein
LIIGGQRVHIDVFDRHLKPVISVLPASALALADPAPVCGPVAGPGKAGSIDEGLHQTQIVTVFCYPVMAQSSEACTEDTTGQMGDPNPWKDQKAGVVGYQAQILPAGRPVPADKSVTWGGFPGRRTKQQAGNGAFFAIESDILHVFADVPFASEIMVSIHKAMEEVIGDSAALHRYQLYRADLTQIGFDRIAIVGDIGNASLAITAVAGNGQRNKPLLLKFSQHAATGHVFEQARFRSPPPMRAQFFGQTRPVPMGILGNQMTYCFDISWCKLTPLNGYDSAHASQHTRA